MIHPDLFLGGSETGFYRPASKCHLQQPSQGDAIASDDLIGEEIFDFAGANAASDDQCMLPRWKFVFGFSPKPNPFDFPYLGAAIGVFDAETLP